MQYLYQFLYVSSDILLLGTFANYAAALSIQKLGARGGAVGYEPVLSFMESMGIDTTAYRKVIQSAKSSSCSEQFI